MVGAVPTIGKMADVTPVSRKGDKSGPGNYYQISVIPEVGKVPQQPAFEFCKTAV